MRQSAMESLAETKKRNGDSEAGKRRRKMSNGSDRITFLQQRYQVDSELKREEGMNERKAQQDFFIAQQAALTNTLKETISTQTKTTRAINPPDSGRKCSFNNTYAENCKQGIVYVFLLLYVNSCVVF